MDRIRNEYIRGTEHVRCFGENAREARLKWFVHLQRRVSILEDFEVGTARQEA